MCYQQMGLLHWLEVSLPPYLGMDLLGYWQSVKSHLTFSTAQEEAHEVKAACLSASGQHACCCVVLELPNASLFLPICLYSKVT